jgi:predicted flap endonuclease-1-like 5' DNA nuclease
MSDETAEPRVSHVSRNGEPRNADDAGGPQELRVEHDGETYTVEKGDDGLYEHPGEDAPDEVVQAVAGANGPMDGDRYDLSPPTEDAPEETETEELQRIDGVGPARADDLRAEGVETLADLARTDPATVATATDVSEETAEEFVAAAVEVGA